jgi:hypothetical protein
MFYLSIPKEATRIPEISENGMTKKRHENAQSANTVSRMGCHFDDIIRPHQGPQLDCYYVAN